MGAATRLKLPYVVMVVLLLLVVVLIVVVAVVVIVVGVGVVVVAWYDPESICIYISIYICILQFLVCFNNSSCS